MKKLLPHVIYIFIIAFFIVYANIKANEAEKMAAVALEQTKLAERNATEAERAQQMAQQAMMEAERQAALARMEAEKAQEALSKCR